MKCKKCGNELDDIFDVCPLCAEKAQTLSPPLTVQHEITALKKKPKFLLIMVAIIVLVGVIAWAGVNAIIRQNNGPVLSVTTGVKFSFQEMKGLVLDNNYHMRRGLPSAPNTWKITFQLLNKDKEELEILPIFFLSEGYQTTNKPLENAMAICPEIYRDCFSTQVTEIATPAYNNTPVVTGTSPFNIITAPTNKDKTVTQWAPLPESQLNEPPEGSFSSSIAVMDFLSALTLDGKANLWSKLSLQPKSKLNCSWEMWSTWAAPAKERTSENFCMVHLGPVVYRKSDDGRKAFLVVIKLKPSAINPATSWVQSSFQLPPLTSVLAKDLQNELPNCPSVAAFAKSMLQAVVKKVK